LIIFAAEYGSTQNYHGILWHAIISSWKKMATPVTVITHHHSEQDSIKTSELVNFYVPPDTQQAILETYIHNKQLSQILQQCQISPTNPNITAKWSTFFSVVFLPGGQKLLQTENANPQQINYKQKINSTEPWRQGTSSDKTQCGSKGSKEHLDQHAKNYTQAQYYCAKSVHVLSKIFLDKCRDHAICCQVTSLTNTVYIRHKQKHEHEVEQYLWNLYVRRWPYGKCRRYENLPDQLVNFPLEYKKELFRHIVWNVKQQKKNMFMSHRCVNVRQAWKVCSTSMLPVWNEFDRWKFVKISNRICLLCHC